MFALRCIITVLWITTLVFGGSEARSETFVRTHIELMGQYYAGHGEFPWVVEIRGQDSENWGMQEEWSIGNLIGPNHVLTTCNAVATFILVHSVRDRYRVKPKNDSKYKVMYSPDYPYHSQWWFIKYEIRTKSIWKAALMPTWGRDYSDKYSKHTMLFNFKVKYQVKFQEWEECQKVASKMGWASWNAGLKFVSNTFCMSLYKPDDTMGAICDHDRGAPIVWEGYVVGIVVTGAHITECSNLNPLPFVVQSIQDAHLYWTNVQRNILSYFITDKTHLFPGVSGILGAASISPPRPIAGGLALLIVGLLLILRPS